MKHFFYKLKNAKVGTSLFMLFLAALWLMPTISLLIVSIRPKDAAENSPWWTALLDPLNQAWTFEAFEYSLVDAGMLDSFVNTLAVTIPSVVLPLLVAANAAYAFTFLEFKGREIYFAILIGLMVIPLQSALIPVLRSMVAIQKTFGIQLTGTFVSAWIIHSAFAMPLAIYILRNYMLSLPSSLIEAARIDGASYYQIFWRLVMPMSVPALASFAIFQFLWVWNDYLIAFVFVGEQKSVMTYKLLRMLGQYGDGWQNVLAGSFISLILPVIVFFALQRYFVRGLTAGAVK